MGRGLDGLIVEFDKGDSLELTNQSEPTSSLSGYVSDLFFADVTTSARQL